MINFRTRTDYSLLYSSLSLESIVEKVKQDNDKTLIIVEKDNMASAVEAYKLSQKNNLKMLIATEIMCHQADFIGERNVVSFPLILLAKNEEGYKELMELSSISYLDGLYKTPRINLKLLFSKKNIIAIDPSVDGYIWKNIENIKLVNDYINLMKNNFNNDFYIGFSFSDNKDKILNIASVNNVNLLPTFEVLYENSYDDHYNLLYRLIGLDEQLTSSNELKYMKKDCHFRDTKMVTDELSGYQFIIDNANQLIDSINYKLSIGNPTPPGFKFFKEYAYNEGLGNISEKEYFAIKCQEGLKKRLPYIDNSLHNEYKERLKYEIDVISNMNFPGYMLIVWDFIREAKKLGVPVGPGRGSAAGSLVAYALEITDIDPIKYGLLFERFLNPERVSMPDIDIDFCTERRSEVISYVVNKYGFKSVGQISTFSTLLPKGVIKDVAKVMGIQYSESDFVTKKIPDTMESLSEIDDSSELNIYFNTTDSHKEWLQNSIKLEGFKRNAGMHAAGVVISDEEIWKKAPIRRDKESITPITQYSLDYMEDVDLIKFDFLGLKTLTVIEYARKMIKENHNIDIDFLALGMEDKNIFDLISTGFTTGLFQIESGGMQSLCKSIHPDSFEEIVAILALYRPGPMNSGMVDDFIERKHGRQEIKYDFDALSEVLGPTFGVPVYQEQIMSIVQKIGGFSLGNADVVRRAMGKKKPEIMQQYKQEFIDGGVAQGYESQKVGDLFDKIAGFAEYGFNKSHSAAYAMITYQTAWLKFYYPVEFMAALMTFNNEDSDKLSVLINEAKRLNISILPPCVNESEKTFTASKNGAIRFGLSMIKGFGDIAATEVVTIRRRIVKFKKIEDFLSKVNMQTIKKDGLEALITSGAMDVFGYSRARLFKELELLIKWSATNKAKEVVFARSIFNFNKDYSNRKISIPFHKEWDTIIKYEKEVKSNSVALATDNPIENFKTQNKLSEDVSTFEEPGRFSNFIIINSVKQKTSKNNKIFVIAQCINANSAFEAIMFQSDFEIYNSLSDKNSILQADIEVKINDAGFKNIAIKRLKELKTLEKQKENKTGEMVVFAIDSLDVFNSIENYSKKIKNGYKKAVVLLKEKNGKAKIIEIETLIDDGMVAIFSDYVNMAFKWLVLASLKAGVNNGK